MRPADLGTPFDDKGWTPAVCPPYGVGRKGPEVEVQLKDGRATCTPFRVRIGGARLSSQESGAPRVRLFDHDQDYLLRSDGTAVGALRDPVSESEAAALVALLTDGEEGLPLQLSEEIARLGERAPLASLCPLVKRAWRQGRTKPQGQPARSSETHLLVRLTLVIAAELALVLGEPLPELHERLFPRG